MVAVNERDLREARFNASADVAPKRGGVLGGRENTPAALPPSSATNRRVITKMAPPERPDKFENRQPYIERNHGMSVDKDTMAEMKRNPAPANTDRGPKNGMAGRPTDAAAPANADRGRPMGNDAGRPAANNDVSRPAANNNNDVNRPAANVDNARQVNAENGRNGNGVGRQIPRPPENNDRRVINLEGNGADNAAKGNQQQPGNGNATDNAARSQRYVPRPPAERRPASGAEGTPAANTMKQDTGNNNRAPDSTGRPVARPEDGVKATAPEDRRSPVFDRNNNAGEQKKAVEAEAATPRNVPRPPEGSQMRSAPDSGTFNRRSAPDTSNVTRTAPVVNERRSAPDVSERRTAPDNAERRSAPQPPAERRAPEARPAPETRSAPVERQQQKEERKSAPPAEKQNSEPAKKTSSMNYTETPRFAESSRSPRVPKPPYAGSATVRETSYTPRTSSYTPRESSYTPRASSSSSPRYESSAPSYSRSTPSYSQSSPSYSRSPSYSAGGGSRSYSAPQHSSSSGSRSSYSHAASSSSGGGRSSSASRGSSSSGSSASHASSRH